VYNRALAASETEQLALPVDTQGVADDKAALTLGDTGAVVADLTLPATGRLHDHLGERHALRGVGHRRRHPPRRR
jgi:hypothetical protein